VKDVKDDKIELLTQIYKRLYALMEENKKAVVMVDEVQMLNCGRSWRNSGAAEHGDIRRQDDQPRIFSAS
jgi:hypothetical protein